MDSSIIATTHEECQNDNARPDAAVLANEDDSDVTVANDDHPEDDSDATTIDLQISPKQYVEHNNGESDGSTSLESVYEVDSDYSGPPPQSQPCQKCGVCYLPEGWRRTYVKRRKLNFDNVD